MIDSKIKEACMVYYSKLNEKDVHLTLEVQHHLMYMIEQIENFLEGKRKEKANRWLGFVQGVLWSNRIYSIKELKDHNKPRREKHNEQQD